MRKCNERTIKMKTVTSILLVLAMAFTVQANDLVKHLQDISVTIKAPSKFGGESQGSGTVITRVMKDSDGKDVKVNFIWTAAHVVDGLRNVRTVVDSDTGTERKVVEFRPAFIVKELSENGRRVGELKMEVKVVKYSDASNGHDLALLMVRKTDFVDVNAEFYLEGDKTLPIGTQLFHVGSLLGQVGANSMTNGIMSQVGRVVQLSDGNPTLFDQTTVTAFPGSSGGGVFLATEGEHKGKYVGMLVRGAGETFNLIVPVRRMYDWSKGCGLLWALDTNVPMPTLKEIEDITVETTGMKWKKLRANGDTKAGKIGKTQLHFRIVDDSTRHVPPQN